MSIRARGHGDRCDLSARPYSSVLLLRLLLRLFRWRRRELVAHLVAVATQAGCLSGVLVSCSVLFVNLLYHLCIEEERTNSDPKQNKNEVHCLALLWWS
jgi:hypothetical protein